MSEIHQTAIVEDGARIGNDVRVGPYSTIGADVVLEDGVVVHSHAIVTGHTHIGAGTTGPFLSPSSAARRRTPATGASRPTVVIGANCIIREQVTIHRGTARGKRKTTDRRQLLPDGRLPCRP